MLFPLYFWNIAKLKCDCVGIILFLDLEIWNLTCRVLPFKAPRLIRIYSLSCLLFRCGFNFLIDHHIIIFSPDWITSLLFKDGASKNNLSCVLCSSRNTVVMMKCLLSFCSPHARQSSGSGLSTWMADWWKSNDYDRQVLIR